MNNETTQIKQIFYEWFCSHPEVTKDRWRDDRGLWDQVQFVLIEKGHNLQHDEIKDVIRRMDKEGWFGGRSNGDSFEHRADIVQQRKDNRRETGHPEGLPAVKDNITTYAAAMSEKLKTYRETPYWANRSREYRESVGFVCELCLKQHPRNSRHLVAHHRSYYLEDGSECFYKETDRELIAVCRETCHPLADIARYVRVGRLSKEAVDSANEPLLLGLR